MADPTLRFITPELQTNCDGAPLRLNLSVDKRDVDGKSAVTVSRGLVGNVLWRLVIGNSDGLISTAITIPRGEGECFSVVGVFLLPDHHLRVSSMCVCVCVCKIQPVLLKACVSPVVDWNATHLISSLSNFNLVQMCTGWTPPTRQMKCDTVTCSFCNAYNVLIYFVLTFKV